MLEARTFTKLGLTVFAAAVLVLGVVTEAEAALRSNSMITAIDFSRHPCNGEPLLGTVRIHMLVTTEDDEAGGIHVHFLFQVNGSVESLVSEDQFVVQDVRSVGLDVGPGIETTRTESFQVIGKGKAPDFTFHGVAHVTVNPNGEVAASFVRTGETCG